MLEKELFKNNDMFDFDTPHNRYGTNSLKWNVAQNELAMWVADMDFMTAPAIIEALSRRVQTGIYGYSIVPQQWYSAIINWWNKQHNFLIENEWLCFCTGVVPAISSMVKRLTNIGDNVLVQTPVYDIFFHSIENAGRHVLENALVYENGEYNIDFLDLENKLANPITTMMILCNPHNPIGKVWTKAELKKIGDMCKKNGVVVIADEIHCDLIQPGCKYVPFASVSENCLNNSIVCVSASKSFNLAGLQSAATITANPNLRNIIVRGLNSDEIAEPNCFATDATIAAFSSGEQWLVALKAYLLANKKIAETFLAERIPQIKLLKNQATYLLWLDCSAVSENAQELATFIQKDTGLYLSSGNEYRGNGKMFLRLNIACQKTNVLDGLQRLENGVNKYIIQRNRKMD